MFNRANTIGRTLASIDSQRVRPARVVLVDNNSTDASLAIIEGWAEGKGYVDICVERVPGACAARNRGLKEVATPWTMFFDSDDVMLPNHVADFTRAIEANPKADVIGRDIYTKSVDGSTRRLYYHAAAERKAMFHHLFRGSLSTQRYIARTSLFRSVGGWDETLPGWDDFELGVRIIMRGPRMVDVGGEPSVVTYQQEESITGMSFTANQERWEWALDAIRSDFSLLPEDATQRKYLDWLDARSMILAAQYEREARMASSASPAKRFDTIDPEVAHGLSVGLRDKILSRTRHPARQRLVYLHNLYVGRLTWLLAKMMF